MADTWQILIGRSTLIERLIGQSKRLKDKNPKINARKTHLKFKILAKKKGGGFLAGDLPMSTSSILLGSPVKFKFQVACFELLRVRSSNFGFPQVLHGTSV